MLFRNSLLRTHQGFRNLWLGQAISQVGDALFYVSFMFMVKKLTGSDAMVGIVGAAETLPFFLLGPYSGVLADRIDRRLILLWSDLLSAGVLLTLAAVSVLAYPVPGWSLVLTGFCLATIRTFFFPAKNAAIPRLVEKDELQAAFALSIGTQNIMMMLGTAFSATVMAAMYQTMSAKAFLVGILLLNAASFLSSAYFIRQLPVIKPERKGEQSHALIEFREGLRFIRKRADLMMLLLVMMLFGLSVAPFFVTYVAANDAWFGGKPSTLAWCEFAFFAGMVIGSAVVAKRPTNRPGLSFICGAAVVGIGVGLMAISRNPWVFSGWNVLCGLVVPYIDIPMRSYLQATVPDSFRGRVNSVQNMTNTAVMPIGMASAGSLVKRFGLVFMFAVMGIAMTAASLLGLLGKDFRNARMPASGVPPRDEESVPDPIPMTA